MKTHIPKDDFTQKLEEIVLRTKMSDDARSDYMMRNIFADDWFDRGKTEGIAQGAHDARVETARGMLSDNLLPKKIAKYTGLSLAEVQQLQIGMKAAVR